MRAQSEYGKTAVDLGNVRVVVDAYSYSVIYRRDGTWRFLLARNSFIRARFPNLYYAKKAAERIKADAT